MESTKWNKWLWVLLPCALLVLAACSKDDSEVQQVPVSVSLKFNTAWKSQEPHVAPSRSGSKVRYVVRFFNEGSRTPVAEVATVKDAGEGELNTTLTASLPPGDYKVLAWTDFGTDASGSGADFPYKADDFADIRLTSSSEVQSKDAFGGSASLSVPTEGTAAAEVPMARKTAHFELITGDASRFLQWSGAGSAALDSCRARIIYPGFFPDHFSLFVDATFDASEGRYADVPVRVMDGGKACVGADYVLSSAAEKFSLLVQLEIVDKRGKRLLLTRPFAIDLERNVNTVVEGNWLMGSTSGGIGIDTGYDGDFNI